MIPTINLLPYHTDRLSKRRRNAYTWLGVSVIAGVLLTIFGGWYYEQRNTRQDDLNTLLKAENTKLDTQLIEVSNLKKEIEALLDRQLAVEAVQNDRNKPVQLLEELVKIVPEGAYLTEIKQANNNFTVKGIAQSNERVSEFLRNVSTVPWLDKAELVESKYITVGVNSKEQQKLYSFGMKFAYREAPKQEKKETKDKATPTVASGSK